MKPTQPTDLPLAKMPANTAVDRQQEVPAFNIEAIFQLAIEKQGTAETLEKLMSIRRELNEEAARHAFSDALAALQAELPVIPKSKFGAKNAYKYAPLDVVVPMVQPLLTKHGFSFTITSEVEKDWVKAFCKVKHHQGHSEVSEFKVPVDQRNPMMNDPQRYAGSLTFCKRYAFMNAFGIMTGDEDTDGSTVKPRAAGPMSESPPKPETPQSNPEAEPHVSDAKTLRSLLWALMKRHDSTLTAESNWNAVEEFLRQNKLLAEGKKVSALDAAGLESLINAAKEKLQLS